MNHYLLIKNTMLADLLINSGLYVDMTPPNRKPFWSLLKPETLLPIEKHYMLAESTVASD